MYTTFAWGVVVCFSKARLRSGRVSHGLAGKVQIHHVIPQERFRRLDPVLTRYRYDSDAAYNLMWMPTQKGAKALNLHPNRPIHDGGHPQYNAYVRKRLTHVSSAREMQELVMHLRRNLRRNEDGIPWP